jgi:ABC-type glycerol-3-phosphate transport system substrate-binding protein
MKNKKIIIIALFISVLFISACQADPNVSDDADNIRNDNVTAEPETPVIEATETRLEPDLPSRDFEALEIRLLGRAIEYDGNVKHYSEASSEEETGELMNDAIHRRNRQIEAKYNVNIIGVLSNDRGSLYDDIRRNVNAGDNNFDAAFASIGDSSRLSQEGLIADLKDVPNLNLSQPWWDQRAVNSLSIGGSLYFTVGDITPWADPFTWIVVVNKELIADYGLENPYQLVRDNNWTFDKFYELCVAVSSDTIIGGNEFGRHGVMSGRENFAFKFIAGGENIIRKDSDDLPYLALNNDRAVNVAQKIFDMMSNKQATLLVDDYFGIYADPWFEVLRAQFRNGNGLFYMGGLEQMLIFRDLETEIGVLPMPKYDSNQNGYYHILNTYWASSLCIPVTNDKLDETGFILEALAAESRYTVRPAFYDHTLTQKMIRDEDSAEMLDIILASRAYDLGLIYNWGDIGGFFSNMLARGAFTFVSDIERRENMIQSQMERTIDRFLDN